MRLHRNYISKFVLFLIAGIAHTVLASQLDVLTIIPDELNTMGIAAWFAGEDWSGTVSNYRNYYGYGQAILYSPLFLLIKDGFMLVRAILVLNGILMSFIPVIAYSVLERINVGNDKINFLLAAIVGCSPAYYLNSKYTWNEALLMFLMWLVWWIIVRMLLEVDSKVKKQVYSVFLGLVLSWGIITHERFYAVVATVIVFSLGYWIVKKKRLIGYIPVFLILYLTTVLDKCLKPILLREVWRLEDESLMRNTIGELIKRILPELSNSETWICYIRALSGNIFYLFVASMGIAMLFLVVFFTRLVRKSKIENAESSVLKSMFWFLLVQTVFTIGMEIVFFTTEYLSMIEYYYIYGRYTEFILGAIIMCVIVYLTNTQLNKMEFFVAYFCILINSGIVFWIEGEAMKGHTIVNLNIYTLLALSPTFSISDEGDGFLIAIIIFLMITLVLFLLLYFGKKQLSLILLGVTYVVLNYRIATNLILPTNDSCYQNAMYCYQLFESEEMRNVGESTSTTIIVYKEHPHYYRSALRNWDVRVKFDEGGTVQENVFFIFPTGVPQNLTIDYEKLYIIDQTAEGGEATVCVYGDELKEIIEREGIKVVN